MGDPLITDAELAEAIRRLHPREQFAMAQALRERAATCDHVRDRQVLVEISQLIDRLAGDVHRDREEGTTAC